MSQDFGKHKSKIDMKQDSKNEKVFFDRFNQSRGYDVLTSFGYHSIIKNFKKYSGGRLKGARIIDLGCGTGAFTRQLASHVQSKFFGVDISLKAIQIARDKNDGIQYWVVDLAQLGIKGESFDVVVFSGVLHHFPDMKPCLAEGYRILKPGGCLLSFDPHLNNPFMWFYRHRSSPFYSKCGKTDNEALLSINQMKKVLAEVGFSMIDVHPISGVTFKYVQSRIGRFFLPFYNIFEFLLGISSCAQTMGSFLVCYGVKQNRGLP